MVHSQKKKKKRDRDSSRGRKVRKQIGLKTRWKNRNEMKNASEATGNLQFVIRSRRRLSAGVSSSSSPQSQDDEIQS